MHNGGLLNLGPRARACPATRRFRPRALSRWRALSLVQRACPENSSPGIASHEAILPACRVDCEHTTGPRPCCASPMIGPPGGNTPPASRERGLLTDWPEGGPKLAWQVSGMGIGFSTPAVADGRVFLMGNREGQEMLLALSAVNKGANCGPPSSVRCGMKVLVTLARLDAHR